MVALAWAGKARVPAARARLNAIVARTSQAAFAVNRPDVIWQVRQGPGFEVGVDLLDDRVAAVRRLGLQHDQRRVGEHRMVTVAG